MALCKGIEPAFPSDRDHRLEDLAYELVSAAGALAGQIHPLVRQSIGDWVRSLNCHYSNLIEGHNTALLDIERAVAQDYSADPRKRNLQLEAVAHIEVQRRIDLGTDEPAEPASAGYLKWLHQEFCSRLPEDLLWVEKVETGERLPVVPGQIRTRYVKVGAHVPPVGYPLTDCLDRLEEVYACRMSRFRKVIAIPAAHLRLLWIHPFLDGNGRIARLVSHAMFQRLGIGRSLWAVSRGLARNAAEYQSMVMASDRPPERALEEFCGFFLRVALDEVRFIQSILDPGNLLRLMEFHCREESDAGRLPKAAFPVLREALLRGAVERGAVPGLVGLGERACRNVTADLLSKGLLVSPGPRAPLSLGFPVEAAVRWFPGL